MNCPYCAQIIPDDVRFCPRCGTEMGSPLPESPAYRAPVPTGFHAPTSGKAIGSLICGIFFFFFPASIVAIVLGHLSLSEIRKSAGRLKGQGLATVGLILGYMGVVAIPLILIIAAIAIPNLLRARMAANEASAIGALRSYSYALGTYSTECPKIGFPASLENLGPRGVRGLEHCARAGAIDGVLGAANPTRSGYRFVYSAGATNESGQVTNFAISAEPLSVGSSGQRFFFVDESGVIRSSIGEAADADSAPLE